MSFSVCAVIVTYNRLDKLKKTLASYSAQILPPKYLVVVNNASTDGTADFLNGWQNVEESFKKIVITSDENLGGSGGFYLGQEKAITLDADWILLADDDAYPEPDYLEGLLAYINKHNSKDISIVCGKVKQGNSYVNEHRSYLNNKWSIMFYTGVPVSCYQKEVFYPDLVSYVGIVINKEKLVQAGLVNKDYFIWQDDNEHSCRLRKIGKIVCLPKYDIIHDCDVEHMEFSWKAYYGYRNRIDLIRRHFKSRFPFTVILFLLKTVLCPVKGRTFAEVKLRCCAIKDGIQGKLGKHYLYKPGWKP